MLCDWPVLVSSRLVDCSKLNILLVWQMHNTFAELSVL
jgi:hypothetical protein